MDRDFFAGLYLLGDFDRAADHPGNIPCFISHRCPDEIKIADVISAVAVDRDLEFVCLERRPQKTDNGRLVIDQENTTVGAHGPETSS